MSYSHNVRKKAIKKSKGFGTFSNYIVNPKTGVECTYKLVDGVWKLVPYDK